MQQEQPPRKTMEPLQLDKLSNLSDVGRLVIKSIRSCRKSTFPCPLYCWTFASLSSFFALLLGRVHGTTRSGLVTGYLLRWQYYLSEVNYLLDPTAERILHDVSMHNELLWHITISLTIGLVSTIVLFLLTRVLRDDSSVNYIS